MKFLIALSLILTVNAKAALVMTNDQDKNCTLYRTTSEENPIQSDEVVVLEKEAYGITLVNLEVDFKQKIALATPEVSVVLGFNRKLTENKAFIKASNPNFTFLINQVNRRILLLEKICINKNNEIIYGTQYETKEK